MMFYFNDSDIEKKLDELIASKFETEVTEFKEAKNSFSFDELGRYFSALSNEANLHNKECAWLVFGVEDKKHIIVGTTYRTNDKDLNSLKEEIAKQINYYHNNLHGSFSIKKVLPIFTNLSYADLDVHNGTEAVYTYGILPTLTDKEYEDKYLALRKYCQQDTWAMVEILWGLKKEFNI
mgnify:CR=1 FL=1